MIVLCFSVGLRPSEIAKNVSYERNDSGDVVQFLK